MKQINRNAIPTFSDMVMQARTDVKAAGLRALPNCIDAEKTRAVGQKLDSLLREFHRVLVNHILDEVDQQLRDYWSENIIPPYKKLGAAAIDWVYKLKAELTPDGFTARFPEFDLKTKKTLTVRELYGMLSTIYHTNPDAPVTIQEVEHGKEHMKGSFTVWRKSVLGIEYGNRKHYSPDGENVLCISLKGGAE